MASRRQHRSDLDAARRRPQPATAGAPRRDAEVLRDDDRRSAVSGFHASRRSTTTCPAATARRTSRSGISRCRRRRIRGRAIRCRSTRSIRSSSSRTKRRINGGVRPSAGRTTTSNGSARGSPSISRRSTPARIEDRNSSRVLISQMRETAEPMLSQGPIYLGYRLGHVQSEGRVFRALVYNKAAVVLHMLRRLMGDDAVLQGHAGVLSRLAVQQSGHRRLPRDHGSRRRTLRLDRFFERWILGSTIPRVRVTPRIDAGRQDGGRDASNRWATSSTSRSPSSSSTPTARPKTITVPVTEATVEHRSRSRAPARRIFARDELTFVEIVR